VLKLADTPNATKPLAGTCDSARCPQATHHPGHRPVWLPDPRDAQNNRLKQQIDALKKRLAGRDQTITELTDFKPKPSPAAGVYCSRRSTLGVLRCLFVGQSAQFC